MGMSTIKSPRSESFQTPDSNLSWDVPFEELENISSDEELSLLVRNSYLVHLKRCLIKNYEKWVETTQPAENNLNDNNVGKFAKTLEKKALRSCMIASYYQKAMVQIIADVKTATQKKILFNSFLEGKKEEVCNKSVQTETVELNLEGDAFLNPNNGDSKEKLLPRTESIDSYEELLYMLMSPQPVQSPFESTIQENTSNNRKRKIIDFPFPEDTQKIKFDNKNRPPLEDRLQSLSNLFDHSDSPVKEVDVHNQKSLDIENFHENLEKDVHMRRTLPHDWEAELSVQECNLEIILESLSSLKRIIVEKRFKDLFGNKETIKYIEVANSCRKKTASLVVGELTPYYRTGKIASRQVFKHLAKIITERIMKKTYEPGLEVIKKRVDEAFIKVPNFTDISDINYI